MILMQPVNLKVRLESNKQTLFHMVHVSAKEVKMMNPQASQRSSSHLLA